jgi:acylphosphatase
MSWLRGTSKGGSDDHGQGTASSRKRLPDDARRVHMVCSGRVQGVGFRWTCQNVANELGLTGWVRNEYDGTVTLELQGSDAALSAFFPRIDASYRRYPIRYSVGSKEELPLDPHESGFEVRF